MPGSLLVPITVTAKVLKQQITVPQLMPNRGGPFNRNAVLEPGIHLHWALPDALTRARMLPQDKEKRSVFPGVPDLWVVARLNPVPANPAPNFKRTWRAWIVDSRRESAKPLEQWAEPDLPAGSDPHTVVGLLPSASAIGRPGWGIWKADRGEFDPAIAAYYPASRKRFGFHDPITDLAHTGNVSYVVTGWYSTHEHDPLYNADDKEELLLQWKLAPHRRPNDLDEIVVHVALNNATTAQPWQPATIKSTSLPKPTISRLRASSRMAARGETHSQRVERVRKLQSSIPTPPILAQAPTQSIIDALGSDSGPTEIVCHGSVVQVPLGGVSAPTELGRDQVHLYPSVARATAAIAALETSEEGIEHVEMMLDDLDHQTATLSGVLDLPGAAHAHTFQSVPGKAQAYARLEIFSKGIEFLPSEPQHFNLMVRPSDDGRRSSGHWPRIAKRSAQISQGPKIEMASPGLTMQIPPRASAGPTDAEIDTWVNKVLATLEGVKAARDVDIHPRLIRVQDHRRNAQSGALGRSADGGGSDNAGWWLEIKKSVKDNIVLRELYRSAAGARIWLPDATNLYRLPGPNWYRPWSPQIVLLGAGRSYKYGEDSRFRDDGFVTCRFSGETLSGIRIGPQATIRGREALANAVPLTAMPSVPKEVRALVEETLLLDPDSSAVLRLQISATTRLSDAVFKSAIRGLWLKRDSELLSEAENKAMAAVQGLGQVPSGIAITPWGEDPHDPLFVDVEYAHPHSSLQEDWTLEPDSVEMTPAAPKATQPPAGQVIQLQERAYVTSTIAKVLDSKLVSKLSVDQKGNLVRAQTRPKGVEDTTFKKLDVLSAPLTQFDEKLFGTGRRERTGALRINRLELVDVYGVVRRWNSGITDGNSPAGGNDLAWWTELPPRLPYWSRLQVRLQAAFNPSVDATPLDPIICGFLLPDFLEHSLEVFDGMGMALGQLVSDRPQKDSMGATAETILKVKFVPHPWVQSGNGHLTVITNPILRSVVAGLEAQETKVPPGQPSWFETGLTAFLRVVDTIRSLLDPSVKAPDLKVRLLGEPIVVLQTRLTLEGTSNRSPSSLVGRPEPLASEPSLPSIHVRVGDVNRPDDGVLGCFLPPPPGEEVDSSKSRFAPVSKEAAEKALINGMVHELKGWVIPVDHPFIKEQVSEFDIRVGETKDLTVLMDTRGGMYATCGVLPRKKITLPREHLDMGLGHLEPTFRTGPVLAQVEKDSIKPAIPSIDLQGLDSQLVRQLPNSSNFDETPLPKVLPVSELPQGRVFLTEGWVRVSRPKLQK